MFLSHDKQNYFFPPDFNKISYYKITRKSFEWEWVVSCEWTNGRKEWGKERQRDVHREGQWRAFSNFASSPKK